jgi:two-component system, chemotaxis family, chemotaxis protein CheY
MRMKKPYVKPEVKILHRPDAAKQRRSQRVMLQIAVLVQTEMGGRTIQVGGFTRVVNAHGGSLESSLQVPVNHQITLINPQTSQQAKGRVIGTDRLSADMVAMTFEFHEPVPGFWPITSPPADWEVHPEQLASRRILLVDDSEMSRQAIGNILRSRSWTVCGEAENGRIGVEKFKELRPDLVVLDLAMPVLNGIEAAKLMSATDPSIPVILFTVLEIAPLEEPAREAGISAVISKNEAWRLIGCIEQLVA